MHKLSNVAFSDNVSFPSSVFHEGVMLTRFSIASRSRPSIRHFQRESHVGHIDAKRSTRPRTAGGSRFPASCWGVAAATRKELETPDPRAPLAAGLTTATPPPAQPSSRAVHFARRSGRPGKNSPRSPPGKTCNAPGRDGHTRSRGDALSSVLRACWSFAA